MCHPRSYAEMLLAAVFELLKSAMNSSLQCSPFTHPVHEANLSVPPGPDRSGYVRAGIVSFNVSKIRAIWADASRKVVRAFSDI